MRKAERDALRSYRGGNYYSQPFDQQYYPQFSYRRDRYPSYNDYNGYYNEYSYPAPIYPYASTVYVEPYPYYSGGLVTYSPIYVPNYYAYAPYSAYDAYSYGYLPDNYDYFGYYPQSVGWKTMVFRSLIGFVLGDYGNDYYGSQPYDAYYSYSPNLYDYNSYAQYTSYYPDTYYQESYYSQPAYDYSGYEDSLINTIPVGELIGPSYGGYSTSLLREVLAQGYEQGYYAGRHSRRADRKFLRRLYSIDNDFYSPYSDTISQNRRVFAQGYALGYQDALAGRDQYVSGYSRDSDLFSLLTSNVVGL